MDIHLFTNVAGLVYCSSDAVFLPLMVRSGLYKFIRLEEICDLRVKNTGELLRCRLSEAHAVEQVVLI